jgi:hypothetical protein
MLEESIVFNYISIQIHANLIDQEKHLKDLKTTNIVHHAHVVLQVTVRASIHVFQRGLLSTTCICCCIPTTFVQN